MKVTTSGSTSAHCTNAQETSQRSTLQHDGAARCQGESEKHARCPGSKMIPLVVETHGRAGGEAQSWLRNQLLTQEPDVVAQKCARA